MKKRLKPFFILSVFFLFFIPSLALADGMLVYPPDYYVTQTEQKAVVFYEKNIETLVLSITFKGDAEKFGWVVPVPNKPKIEKASDELFTSLKELTQALPQPLKKPSLKVEEGIEIIETQKVEYYDITTLKASDSHSLNEWLNKNNFVFPKSANYILDSYIKNNWYFVAIKIDTSSLSSNVEEQLKEGHAVPLKLTFKSDQIIYPLKISSVMGREDLDSNKGPLWIDSWVKGKALSFDGKDDYVEVASSTSLKYLDKLTLAAWIEIHNLSSGTILHKNNSFELKLEKLEGESKQGICFYVYTEGLSLHSQKVCSEILPPRVKPLEENQNKEKVSVPPLELSIKAFVTATWDGKTMRIFINGMKKASAVLEGKLNSTDFPLIIGTNYAKEDSNFFKGYIDEVRIWGRALSLEEINKLYNKKDPSSEKLVAYWPFDEGKGKIVYDKSGNNNNGSLKYRASGQQTFYKKIWRDGSTSILLYVIADGKKEIPGFNIPYANWIKKEKIEKLAYVEGKPWISNLNQKKYYLTKLYRTMKFSEMNEDLVIRAADNNDPVGVPSSGQDSKRWGLLITFVLSSIITISGIIYIIRLINKPMNLNP